MYCKPQQYLQHQNLVILKDCHISSNLMCWLICLYHNMHTIKIQISKASIQCLISAIVYVYLHATSKFRSWVLSKTLILKAPNTTAADDKFCDFFPNFWQKQGMLFHENRLPADNPHEITCLICYFRKSSKIFVCPLLQIIGGALRVIDWFFSWYGVNDFDWYTVVSFIKPVWQWIIHCSSLLGCFTFRMFIKRDYWLYLWKYRVLAYES